MLLRKRYNIKTQTDLNNLEGYIGNVNPLESPLSHIVDWYYIPSEVRCGLSNCHQPHQHGFLVELKDGKKTNVGNICGAVYQNFEAEKITFSDTFLRPKAIEAINAGKLLIRKLSQKLTNLNNDAEELSELKKRFREKYPYISNELFRRSHNGDLNIMDSVERTNEQIEAIIAGNSFQNRAALRYESVFKGALVGLELFSFNFKEQISNELVKKSLEISNLEISNNTKTSELLSWDSWLNNFDIAFIDAEKMVKNAKLFFTAENYHLMGHLAGSKTETDSLKKLKSSSFDEPKNSMKINNEYPKRNRHKSKRLEYYANQKNK